MQSQEPLPAARQREVNRQAWTRVAIVLSSSCILILLLAGLAWLLMPNVIYSDFVPDSWKTGAAVHGQIVFVSDHDGNPEIYIMDDDGSYRVRLTYNPAGNFNLELAL